uniref:Uncharacterized protein n=1 Tax=Alexandrium catenella TaxID=2925 RepID=A0A7S1W3K9_ALECA
MPDLQIIVFSILSYPAELLLHCSHLACFCCTVLVALLFVSPSAAGLVLLGALLALLASYRRHVSSLPRYCGPLDVLLGRTYRASTLTPSMQANNNVTLCRFREKFVIAYRKSDSHFASPLARILVATSDGDLGEWKEVWDYHTGEDDLRETLLFEFRGRLFLYFACLAPFKRGFTPRRMQWTATEDLQVWSAPVPVGRVSEITWDVKVLKDAAGEEIAYKVSYVGNHYAADAVCTVHFERSFDGIDWKPVGKKEDSAVYAGGISEVTFAFTPSGDLVAIGRNEDGDASGFGSQLFFAKKEDLGAWTPLRVSLPQRFDSPRLVPMDGHLILFARYAREPYALTPSWAPFGLQRFSNILCYSLLPKTAAVYRIEPPDAEGRWSEQPVQVVRCFEETYGDTGFFSIAEGKNKGEWVVANYSSACHSHAAWIYGQLYPTDIYVCQCRVVQHPHA